LEMRTTVPILQSRVCLRITRLTGGGVPFDNCNGHGTHVTGIVAADARNANASQPFVGVAPGVSIFMYRVLGCSGSTSNDVMIDAITRAFNDSVDIISMSIGGTEGWSEDPTSVVADRITQRGVFFSIAAGNDGAGGVFDPSSPAAGTDVTSVASVDNIAIMAFNALTNQNQNIVRALKKNSSLCRATSPSILLPLLDPFLSILRQRQIPTSSQMHVNRCLQIHQILAILWFSRKEEHAFWKRRSKILKRQVLN
jgi:hypothetical protein